MSIAEHIKIEKRFAELEAEVARLGKSLSDQKGRLTVLYKQNGKRPPAEQVDDLCEAAQSAPTHREARNA